MAAGVACPQARVGTDPVHLTFQCQRKVGFPSDAVDGELDAGGAGVDDENHIGHSLPLPHPGPGGLRVRIERGDRA